VGGLGHLAWALRQLGYPDQALQRSRECMALAEKLGHPLTLCLALGHLGSLHRILREPEAVKEPAAVQIKLASEHGFADQLGHGTMLQAWVQVQQGQGEEGIALMRQFVDLARAAGLELGRIAFLTMLAEAYVITKRADEGLDVVAEALDAVNQKGLRSHESYLYRFKGELLQAGSGRNQTEAENSFCQAIDVARHQNAKSLELQAATSLSRLWQKQGKKEEARTLLTPIYNWFTEGFETHDLKEAKALLDELS
jgi:predicted ATPase